MLSFAGASNSPEFVPQPDARDWVASAIAQLAPKLGPAASRPQLLTDASEIGFGRRTPGDLDGLFDMICGVQEVIGQEDVELTLVELDRSAPKLPDSYASLGDSNGKLLHTLRGPDEYVVLFTPAVFKVRELMLAAIARELGRMALDIAGMQPVLDEDKPQEALMQWEADSEIAAVMLGMGIWVANGSYMFENSCCGGGCGVDLRSLRAGLTMPEACYALALDSQRKGLRRRSVVRHLQPTQKSATKQCWSSVGRSTPPALAAAEPAVRGMLT